MTIIEKLTPEIPSDSFSEILAMRYPVVWVHALDMVEAITDTKNYVTQFEDLDFYLFHAVDGLLKHNAHTNRFDTVLTVVVAPDGSKHQVPMNDLSQAMSYLSDMDEATLFVANVEQFNDDLNDLFTYRSYNWRNAYRSNTTDNVGFQLVLASSVAPHPPESCLTYIPTVSMGLPTKSDFIELCTFVKENTKADFDINEVAMASRGLSFYEASSLYHSNIVRTGTIDAKEIEILTFERLAARSGLDIIRPKFNLDQVAGGEEIKEILDISTWIKDNPEEAKRLGHNKNLHRFMLLGLPGCGKSMLCEAAASHIGLNLIRTGMTQMLSKWHGETENNMRALFAQIGALDPIAVWADEFGRDAAGGQSSHLVDGGSTSRMHGLFLTGLQELSETTYFFAAANDISTLAPEMLRADRFDRIFFVGLPTFEQRYKIIDDLLENIDHKINVEKVAVITGGFTGAELVSLMSIASNFSLSDRRETSTDDVKKAITQMSDRMWKRHKSHIQNEYRKAYDNYHWCSPSQHEEAKDYIAGRVPTSQRFQAVSAPSTPQVKATVV